MSIKTFELRGGETVVFESAAQNRFGFVYRFGTLILTNQRIVFTISRRRIHAEYALKDVASVRKGWCLLFSFIPFAIKLATRQGITHKYAVWDRSNWVSLIDAQLRADSAAAPVVLPPPPPMSATT